MGRERPMMMSSTSLLFFIIGLGLCQYDDYDHPGGDPGSGDYGSVTATAPATTKKPSVTTKAPTSTSSKTVVFPKLKSPIAGYKFTKVFGVAVFVHNSVSDAKLRGHPCHPQALVEEGQACLRGGQEEQVAGQLGCSLQQQEV